MLDTWPCRYAARGLLPRVPIRPSIIVAHKMSKDLPSQPSITLTKSRKQVTKTLATGQKITLSPQDDRVLKVIYDYLAGYSKRKLVESLIEVKKREVEQLKNDIPPGAKMLMKERTKASTYHNNNNNNFTDNNSDEEPEPVVKALDPEMIEGQQKVDEYYKAREQLLKLEDRLKTYMMVDHRISFKDLESVLLALGKGLHKRQIEQMIWEVDENIDGMIDFDELQLTYFRNINDTTKNEPCMFFRLLEFLIFDGSNKGYIIEDDCMEILYARYGGGNLEREMKLLFGNRLRAEGGDGTLNLDTYMESVMSRIGRRALVC